MRFACTVLVLLLSISFQSTSQNKIEIEDYTLKETFKVATVESINWMKDGRFYTALSDNKVVKYDVTTGGEVETLVDGNATMPAISIGGYTFSDDEQKLLLMDDRRPVYRRSFTARYFVYDLGSKKIAALSDGRQSYGTFSPDGKKVAFTRDNNLFWVDLESGKETQITKDGSWNNIINGSADWVYEEELYLTKAFEWSPDSRKIAFYRFDEREVKEYNLQLWNDGQLYPIDYRYKYPKAGEKNSKVEILIFDLTSGKLVKAETGADSDIYIARIKWTKNPDLLSVQKLNRLQNELEILHVESASGKSNVVLAEKSETYIDFTFCDDLTYLNNAKHFVYSSERSGYKHFYLYDMAGQLLNQITTGNWEAETLVGIDQSTKTPVLYYISTEISPLERHFYRIDVNGKNKAKLSTASGWNNVTMSTDSRYYINYHSSADQPLNVTLYQTKGNKAVKQLEQNNKLSARASAAGLVKKEFFTFTNRDGVELNGFFLKPADFSPANKYPVLLFQYSGPGSQNVTNSWGGGHFLWHQQLTQEGYVVAVVDPRGTGGRGAQFKKVTYGQLGKYETEDLIDAAKFFKSLPCVDAGRLGIWGWSYGGYMSSLVMFKGADHFKTAIAVAPVTTWRFYDTIYTERYLMRPQDNPSGYDDNSPLSHVSKLRGNFLLIHGTGDDNVHFQNSVTLEGALIEAGKQFETFYYPDKAHGIAGGKTRYHLYNLMTDYILENL